MGALAMTLPLATLEVLALDCQATGAHPGGELLEVGWARSTARALEPPEIESHLVAPTGGLRLPRRIRELTGLTWRELGAAPPARQVGARLAEAVGEGGGDAPQVAVVHFARFEEPYLRQLLSTGGRLPLEVVCTHALAHRLLPTLPRRGLRAVAGYLGHPVPELRRARHHVAATLLIWRGLVALLGERGIHDLEALREWMRKAAPRRGPRTYPMEARLRLDLPHRPGVYRLQRKDGSVLYVGKATSLHQRVNTYFQTSRGHKDRTLEMLAQARAVDVTPTGSALEAALLEPDEIKRLRPPYNVALQERDRRLGYWSWTLRGVGHVPDERHPHGPFPLAAPRPPLAALLQLLDGGGGARLAERLLPGVLGVPRRYAPPLGCFRGGLELFVARHGRWWTRGTPIRSLRALAWRLRRRTPRASEKEPPETGASPRERWSAEGVADALEEVVVRGAHVLGRSRWLCALSECSLAWRPDDGETSRRCLVLSRGAIVVRRDLAGDGAVPVPPGHAATRPERQQALDLAAYDRLSALSRELRGLVAGGGPVTLRLGPDALLDRQALDEALRCL
jgi:DNA polymerase-3 subunit epsilon